MHFNGVKGKMIMFKNIYLYLYSYTDMMDGRPTPRRESHRPPGLGD